MKPLQLVAIAVCLIGSTSAEAAYINARYAGTLHQKKLGFQLQPVEHEIRVVEQDGKFTIGDSDHKIKSEMLDKGDRVVILEPATSSDHPDLGVVRVALRNDRWRSPAIETDIGLVFHAGGALTVLKASHAVDLEREAGRYLVQKNVTESYGRYEQMPDTRR